MKRLIILTAVVWVGNLALLAGACQDNGPISSKEIGTETPTDVQAQAISLEKMAEQANLIFQGRVTKVTIGTKSITGKDVGQLPVQEIAFSVTKFIKSPKDYGVKEGGSLTITQYGRTPSPVKAGEEVVWYLPKVSKHGLVSPIGLYSGHFVIREEYEKGTTVKFVTNLKNNEGLWSEKESIVSRSDAKDFESRLLKAGMDPGRVTNALEFATAPYSPRALPIETLIAATEIYLQRRK